MSAPAVTLSPAEREVLRLRRALEDMPCPFTGCCRWTEHPHRSGDGRRVWCVKAKALGWDRQGDLFDG